MVGFEGFMNSQDYLEILSTRVLPWLDHTGNKQDYILQQDNAPYHKTQAVLDYIGANGINLFKRATL